MAGGIIRIVSYKKAENNKNKRDDDQSVQLHFKRNNTDIAQNKCYEKKQRQKNDDKGIGETRFGIGVVKLKHIRILNMILRGSIAKLFKWIVNCILARMIISG